MKLDHSCETLLKMAFLVWRSHYDFNVVLEVDKHDELLRIFYKDTPSCWVVVVDTSCIMDRVSSGADPNRMQPFQVLVL